MSRFFTRVVPFLLFISFISCNHDKLYQEKCEEYEMAGEDESDEQDGIREAQEMEFELTKDMKLGYIPKYRLVQALEDEMIKTRSGIANKITALTWSERGPNSDILGPGNGNPRGPLGTSTNASNVVTSGRVRAILFDLADPAHKMVWIGSVSGGLWKTNDIASTAASTQYGCTQYQQHCYSNHHCYTLW